MVGALSCDPRELCWRIHLAPGVALDDWSHQSAFSLGFSKPWEHKDFHFPVHQLGNFSLGGTRTKSQSPETMTEVMDGGLARQGHTFLREDTGSREGGVHSRKSLWILCADTQSHDQIHASASVQTGDG